MSDPVTNVEIEDVLSSIRRLVSEDSRPKFDRQVLEKNDENVEDFSATDAGTPEKLVLTAALRVADPIVDPVGEAAFENAEPDAIAEGEVVSFTSPDTGNWPSDSEHGVLDADSLDADETDEIADGFHTSSEDEPQFSAPDTPDKADPAAYFSDEPDSSGAQIAQVDTSHQPSLETRIAEVENAVADQHDQWEPDGEDEGDNAATPVEALSWEDHVADQQADQDHGEDTSEEIKAHGHNTAEDHDADHPEGDQAEYTAEDTDTAPDPHAFDDEIETADPALQTQDFADDATDIETVAASDIDLFGDDTILDEDALREMVSEIVRQELQGALGERITRNVRKLVRREIHRALASQDLE